MMCLLVSEVPTLATPLLAISTIISLEKVLSTFKDDTQLQKGESISSQLLQAIKDSRVSIIVFSKDYADSTWCLDEMAAVAQCHTELKQHVFSVFYDVDPSHVRKQNGVYKSAFDLHTLKNPGKVDGWKRAMATFGDSAGWDVRNKSEVAEIENIVKEVIKKLGHKFSGLADDIIGIQPRVKVLESYLKLSSADEDDGFRVLGIWGMSGIGKTTLAKRLYDRISYQFDACCFIETVSKIYKDGGGRNGGATAVQKEILRQTIDDKIVDSYSPLQISGTVRDRLHNVKLLVVLDDVNQYEQLKELHIDPKLLHAGSRIIITTEDEHILKVYGEEKKLQRGKALEIYEAPLMNDNDARELLCRKASISDDSRSTFAKLIPEVLKYVEGHPLAITVTGSFLCTRNAEQWRATLARWRENPPSKIMEVLRVSYDEGLEREEKEIFLHVACFFKGERKDYVMRILDACGLYPQIGIPVIAEKSLITIRNQEIHMHELLQELGKKIVREEHSDKPELWSRLWLYEDFYKAMKTEMKADMEVEAIVLDHKEEHDFDEFDELIRAAKFHKMKHLKLLILYQKKFSGVPVFLSDSLCYFSWNGYPFTSFPSRVQLRHLVELNMPNSNMEQLWTGVQLLPNLKRMDMSNSKNLKMTPRFDLVENLERLDFTGCINLVEVHPSIGFLKKLQFLSLQNCRSLVGLSFDSGSATLLDSLRVLRLSGTRLKNTPDFTRASYIEYLDMDGCLSLSTIHESVGTLKKLRFLSLRDCTNLVGMPDIFNNMTSLTTLIIESSSLQSVGRYFKTTSGSRDHRSGLYAFDCHCIIRDSVMAHSEWVQRLVKEPRHFRCGFDIVLPYPRQTEFTASPILKWFDKDHRFDGGSIIRITLSVDCVGFVFCVAFTVEYRSAISGSPLPHPFYLSFESEHTEERFDMPLSLEHNKVDGSNYIWTIYISREHCHFVKTGARITFKACQGLIVKEWGLRVLTKRVNWISFERTHLPLVEVIDNGGEESSGRIERKIQLPYNWFISDEDQDENADAKRKETDLCNLGLLTGHPQ